MLGTVTVIPIFVKIVTGIIIAGVLAALAYTTYRVIKHRTKEKTIALILLWWFTPVLMFILIGKNVSPHFFIPILPAQFLIAAIALNKLKEKCTKTAIVGICLVISCFIFFVINFYTVVDRNGGTDSLFGIPYKYRIEVVQTIAKETATPTIVYYGDNKRNMNWLFAHFGLQPTYQHIQSLEEFKEGNLIFDDYDFYSYDDKALPETEREKVRNLPGTTIKHIKVVER